MDLSKQIQEKANLCVKCGLCAPHCPTYQKSLFEWESPRGRIALMEGLAKQQLTFTPKLNTYLDHCLGCRACEAVCPSQVPYGELLDITRAQLKEQHHSPNRLLKMIKNILRYPWRLNLLTALGRFCKRLGLAKFIAEHNFFPTSWRHLNRYIISLTAKQKWHAYYSAKANSQGTVAILQGCIHPLYEADTLTASIKLLNHLGYNVALPKQQTCCGAIYAHYGDSSTANECIQQNTLIFAADEYQAVLSTATGCSSMLKEMPIYLTNQGKECSIQTKDFTDKVQDILAFLAKINWTAAHLKPIKKTVALHIPCTQRNVLKQMELPWNLLSQIPGINLAPLTDKAFCCGAAGLNMLKYPELADTLANDLLVNLIALKPDYIVTSNIGCRIHLQNHLQSQGNSTPIIHPILLLAESLGIEF